MASDKQIKANRLNAKLSTGPQTSEGKKQSSRNATTYGLTALMSTLPYESEEEFVLMRESIIHQLRPKGQIELELVKRIASILWRLRRVPIFETLMMAGLSVETFFKSDFSGRIGRYETTLQRQLSSLFKELRDMQSRREVLERKCEGNGIALEIVSLAGRVHPWIAEASELKTTRLRPKVSGGAYNNKGLQPLIESDRSRMCWPTRPENENQRLITSGR